MDIIVDDLKTTLIKIFINNLNLLTLTFLIQLCNYLLLNETTLKTIFYSLFTMTIAVIIYGLVFKKNIDKITEQKK